MARAPSVPRTAIVPLGAMARVWLVASDHGPVASRGVATGGSMAVAVAGSSRNRTGCERPRSLTVATIVPGSSQYGPGRPVTIQPLRSVSVQLPIGRSRSGASAYGGRDPSAGPIRIPGLTSSSGSASSTPTAASQRPSGEKRAGWRTRPREHRTRRLVVVDVDGPDGRPRVRVGDCDPGPPRTRPSGRRAPRLRSPRPSRRRDLARPGTGTRLDDEQVRPAVEMAGPVPAPVRARDPSGERRAARGLCAGGPPLPGPPAADRRDGPDEESRRIDLGDERQAAAVGRPGELATEPWPRAGSERWRPVRRSRMTRAAGASSSVGSERTNATCPPSGESRGLPSRTSPWSAGVGVRPVPDRGGSAWRWLT